MQEKIDDEVLLSLSVNFLPEDPFNGQPNFQVGLWSVSYRTHMCQVYNKQAPEGSSHSIQGKPFSRAVPLKAIPSTKSDQLKQLRQDKERIDSEMIEETPSGYIVHGRKANPTSQTNSLNSDPPKEKKRSRK